MFVLKPGFGIPVPNSTFWTLEFERRVRVLAIRHFELATALSSLLTTSRLLFSLLFRDFGKVGDSGKQLIQFLQQPQTVLPDGPVLRHHHDLIEKAIDCGA